MTRRFTLEQVEQAVHAAMREYPEAIAANIINELDALHVPHAFERKVWLLTTKNDPGGTTGFHPKTWSSGEPFLHNDSVPCVGYKKEPFTVTYTEGHE